MDREDVIRMAREASDIKCECCLPEPDEESMEDFLVSFAALVVSHERETLLAAQKQEPVGYWDGEFSKDGGAVLYEKPQNKVFMVHPNIPLYTTPPNLQKAAEHWHDLYLAKCRELHDERARLGQQICDLEHDLKEKNHG
jgi:hypothetical protein